MRRLVSLLGGKVHLSLNVCVVVVVDFALSSVRRVRGDCKDVYTQVGQPMCARVSVAQRLARRRTHEVQAVPLCACDWSQHCQSCSTFCFVLSGTKNA